MTTIHLWVDPSHGNEFKVFSLLPNELLNSRHCYWTKEANFYIYPGSEIAFENEAKLAGHKVKFWRLNCKIKTLCFFGPDDICCSVRQEDGFSWTWLNITVKRVGVLNLPAFVDGERFCPLGKSRQELTQKYELLELMDYGDKLPKFDD